MLFHIPFDESLENHYNTNIKEKTKITRVKSETMKISIMQTIMWNRRQRVKLATLCQVVQM